ncbi:MAG TPA: DegT/DnrJ/EryC1/StrS aminotransferase family protein [Anaerolineales bacterium]|nr:DegT/DnrJ/EryC1/StrS aminotransferase family protein [Anaerolineales bacterium]
MIPRVRPSYSWSDLTAAARSQATEVGDFERELASHFGVRHAIAFPYGRSVIHSFLKAFDLAGSEVLQPAYNCVVVAHATMVAGAKPIFVDAQSQNPNQDEEDVIRKVTERTSVVLPTSIFGVPFDAKTLANSIRKRNPKTFILMDCAQCFDTLWNNESLAAQGDASILAFGIGKPMTTLFGGALLTDREDVFLTVCQYRDRSFRPAATLASIRRWVYFIASWVALSGPFVGLTDWLEHAHTPLRSYLQSLRSREAIRLPRDNQNLMKPMEAAIGRTQLKRASLFIQRRREIAGMYAKAFAGQQGLELLNWGEGGSYSIYAARLTEPKNRQLFLDALRRAGIQGDTVLNYVVPGLECYRAENYSVDSFPNALHWSKSVINLPNHPTMSEQQVDHVINTIQRWFKGQDGRSHPVP